MSWSGAWAWRDPNDFLDSAATRTKRSLNSSFFVVIVPVIVSLFSRRWSARRLLVRMLREWSIGIYCLQAFLIQTFKHCFPKASALMRFEYGFTSAAMAKDALVDEAIRAEMFQGCEWQGRLLPPKQLLRLRLGGQLLLGT